MLNEKQVENIVNKRFKKQNEQIMETINEIKRKERRDKIIGICVRGFALAATVAGAVIAHKYKS